MKSRLTSNAVIQQVQEQCDKTSSDTQIKVFDNSSLVLSISLLNCSVKKPMDTKARRPQRLVCNADGL